MAGAHKTAHERAAQLLSLVHRQQAFTFLLPAHSAFGVASFYHGELAVAREHWEQAIALYDPQKHSPQVFGVAVHDLGVYCRSYAAWTLWFLGYPDQALKRIREALTLAREIAHPYSLAAALGYAARLHQFRREGQMTHEQAEAAITLSTDQGFPAYLALGTMLQGWALAERGQREEGIAQIRQGVADWRATGAELLWLYFLALLAETYGKGGQVREGLTVVGEALAIVDKNEERFYEAELYRLKGQLVLQSRSPQSTVSDLRPQAPDPQAEAEACFHKAIEIARKQQAKSLELRATVSLARLWQSQGKKDEARQPLAEIYGWFTEGFDTKDLQEAKALLEELNH
jgi:predicted ATPase